MITTTCHCGRVTISIPRQPETLTNCNCSICRRYGALWAYFRESEVRISYPPGARRTYSRAPKTLQFVRCASCGCVSHWERIADQGRDDRIGINARNFDPEQIGPAKIRLLDGAKTEQYLE